jgi:hypothetical protein
VPLDAGRAIGSIWPIAACLQIVDPDACFRYQFAPEGSDMSRDELEKALGGIRDLWTEIDVQPQLDVGRRDIVAKRATVILQRLADEFDIQRSVPVRF